MIDNTVCEVCPTINVTHDSGVISTIKYCIMEAAMKDASLKYQVCGIVRELHLEAPIKDVFDVQADTKEQGDEVY